MTQIQALFQTLAGITIVSDKITTILIGVVTFFLLDMQFGFSENHRQNEIHSRLKDLLTLSAVGNDTAARTEKGSVSEAILNAEIVRLSHVLENPQKQVRQKIEIMGSYTGTTYLNYRSLHILTSGFWFFLYGFGSLIYLLVLKLAPEPANDPKESPKITLGQVFFVAIFISSILVPLIYLVSSFTSVLPVFYHPVFNYALNIAISGYFLQAVTTVLGGFFGDTEKPAETKNQDDGKQETGKGLSTWFRNIFTVSEKK